MTANNKFEVPSDSKTRTLARCHKNNCFLTLLDRLIGNSVVSVRAQNMCQLHPDWVYLETGQSQVCHKSKMRDTFTRFRAGFQFRVSRTP